MSFLNSVLKVFVGDKSKQDVKALTPIVEKLNLLKAPLSNYRMTSYAPKP